MICLFIDTLVLENCSFRSLKVFEKSLNFVLSVCYEPRIAAAALAAVIQCVVDDDVYCCCVL